MAANQNIRMTDRSSDQRCTQYAAFRRRYLGQWIKDADSTLCMNCSKNFHLFRRRHHCRFCGRLFCASCSSRTQGSTRFIKSVRICGDCLNSEQNAHKRTHNEEEEEEDGDGEREEDELCFGGLWIPDEWVPFCMCCAEIFNWMRSRTHCRKCGEVVCKSCCTGKMKVESLGFIDPVPVCRKCFTKQSREDSFRGSQRRPNRPGNMASSLL